MRQQTSETLEQLEMEVERLRDLLERHGKNSSYGNKLDVNSHATQAIRYLLDIMEDIL